MMPVIRPRASVVLEHLKKTKSPFRVRLEDLLSQMTDNRATMLVAGHFRSARDSLGTLCSNRAPLSALRFALGEGAAL